MLPRAIFKELSDFPIENLEEFNSSARYLKKTNKIFLNYRLIYLYLRPFLIKEKVNKIVDVGTGVGDLPVYLAKKLQQEQIDYFITGVDTNAQVIELAKDEVKSWKNINVVAAQLSDLPFRYDIAIASQVFHHLSPEEAIDFLKTAYKKVDSALIISDLIRSRLIYWLVKLFVFLTTTNRINRYDGGVSVLRCYNDKEIKQLLNKAGIQNFRIHNIFFRKFVIISKANLLAD